MPQLSHDDLRLVVGRLPKDVRQALRAREKKLFVGGGFIRAVVADEQVNDIDLFGASSELLQDVFNTFREDEAWKGARFLQTQNAMTLIEHGRLPRQGITRWLYSDPEKLVAEFDFSVCQAAIWFENMRFQSLVSDRFYGDLAAKRLFYTRPACDEDAGGSMLRAIKYVKRGYRIQAKSLAAIMARTARDFREGTAADMETFIAAKLLEVDPLLVIDGVPTDDNEPIFGVDE